MRAGRNWLHLCCGVDVRGKAPAAEQSVRTAGVLLAHGLDLDAEAFTEDAWKATPLWFAIARGRNLLLAEYLLERGCDPNYALWAAAFNDDLEAIDLLVGYGAIVDDPSVPDETPFLSAVKVSHFRPPPAPRSRRRRERAGSEGHDRAALHAEEAERQGALRDADRARGDAVTSPIGRA